jgi:acetylornithine deacetylase/succinyl-diaminopimelate desuccinylase-like protein
MGAAGNGEMTGEAAVPRPWQTGTMSLNRVSALPIIIPAMSRRPAPGRMPAREADAPYDEEGRPSKSQRKRESHALQTHGEAVFGTKPPAVGTPLYTDVRLYVERGIPGVIYGAGPRSVLESHAKRADERLELEDLRRATKVVARTLADLLQA